MTRLHCHLGARLKAVVGVAAVVVVAVMMVVPAPASAATKTAELPGTCAVPSKRTNPGHRMVLGSVEFVSHNGKAAVEVADMCTDSWSIEAELFWGGEQRRPRKTCWAYRSEWSACKPFELAKGTRVWVYIAQARRSTCDDPKFDRSLGCDKNHWKLAFVVTA